MQGGDPACKLGNSWPDSRACRCGRVGPGWPEPWAFAAGWHWPPASGRVGESRGRWKRASNLPHQPRPTLGFLESSKLFAGSDHFCLRAGIGAQGQALMKPVPTHRRSWAGHGSEQAGGLGANGPDSSPVGPVLQLIKEHSRPTRHRVDPLLFRTPFRMIGLQVLQALEGVGPQTA